MSAARSHVYKSLSKAVAETAVDRVFGSIVSAVGRGEEVRMRGFGSFTRVRTSDRDGRNPRTGEKIKIAGGNAPKFKPATAFKDAVRG